MEPPPSKEVFLAATVEEQFMMLTLAYMIQTENLGVCLTTQSSFQKWYENTAKRINSRGE